jgi:hypothetical protein
MVDIRPLEMSTMFGHGAEVSQFEVSENKMRYDKINSQ